MLSKHRTMIDCTYVAKLAYIGINYIVDRRRWKRGETCQNNFIPVQRKSKLKIHALRLVIDRTSKVKERANI